MRSSTPPSHCFFPRRSPKGVVTGPQIAQAPTSARPSRCCTATNRFPGLYDRDAFRWCCHHYIRTGIGYLLFDSWEGLSIVNGVAAPCVVVGAE